MHGKTREIQALKRAFRSRIPGISEQGLKKIAHAAAYGASTAKIKTLILEDRKTHATDAKTL